MREGLVKGEYTSDVTFLGWLPGCTRCAVAIYLGGGQGIRNDRGQQTLAGCKSSEGRVNTCIHSKELKLSLVILKVRKIEKSMYSQMHLFGVVFHGGPV